MTRRRGEPLPKSEWGDGPWQFEPDELIWTDERTGLECRIIRTMHTGCLCGYVGIPPTHPYFGWGYSDDIAIDEKTDVEGIEMGKDIGFLDAFIYALDGGNKHGTIPLGMTLHAHNGITWAGEIPKGEDHREQWWFGFDCGHCDDIAPAIEALLDMIEPPDEIAERRRLFADNKYRDIEYVRKEVTALAFQLKQLETRKLLGALHVQRIGK